MESAIFNRSPFRPDIYDKEPGISFPFSYCRLSPPRNEWLRKQGAKWVLEVWDHGQKAIFTGLRPTNKPGTFSGDLLLSNRRHQILAYYKYPGSLRITILDQEPKRTKTRLK